MATNFNGGDKVQSMAEGLGWFSIALGVAEFVAPRTVGRLIGVEPRAGLMRLMGLREIITGVGILTQRNSAAWVRSRVAGDAIDLSMLASSLASSENDRTRVAAATAAVVGVTALDVMCARQLCEHPESNLQIRRVKKTLTINRPVEEVYQFWRKFEDFPRFMNHLESVRETGNGRSHWVAKGPAGRSVEWDAEMTEEKPNQRISWRSLPGAQVDNSGSVQFETASGGRGTVIRVEFEYRPPAGALGAGVAKLFGEAPEKQVAVDLRRFKQLVETGEVARTEGQSAGRSKSTSRKYDDFVRT